MDISCMAALTGKNTVKVIKDQEKGNSGREDAIL